MKNAVRNLVLLASFIGLGLSVTSCKNKKKQAAKLQYSKTKDSLSAATAADFDRIFAAVDSTNRAMWASADSVSVTSTAVDSAEVAVFNSEIGSFSANHPTVTLELFPRGDRMSATAVIGGKEESLHYKRY